jgi:hypothetical protein
MADLIHVHATVLSIIVPKPDTRPLHVRLAAGKAALERIERRRACRSA